jgi:hypothetical protein
MRYILGIFGLIPLEMADQPRMVIDHTEQHRCAPFATRRQNLSGTDMTIPMPQYAARRILWLMRTSALCGPWICR